MYRDQIAILCSVLLVWGGPVSAADRSRAPEKPTIQEQVCALAVGTPVEVRLFDKRKLRGRLGDITGSGFVVQHAVKDKIETRTIDFKEVRAIKVIQREEMGRGGLIALSMLAGVGLLVLVMWIVCVAGGCYD